MTGEHEELRRADRIIFPGVGEASTAMAYLRNCGLDSLLPTLKQPFLGICLGMQLMCSSSEEHETRCLGIFPQEVRKFKAPNNEKIPHMGWNTIDAGILLFSMPWKALFGVTLSTVIMCLFVPIL